MSSGEDRSEGTDDDLRFPEPGPAK